MPKRREPMKMVGFRASKPLHSWIWRYGAPKGVREQLEEDASVLRWVLETAAKTLAGRFNELEAHYLVGLLQSIKFDPKDLDDLPLLLADALLDAPPDYWGIGQQVDLEALAVRVSELSPIEAYTIVHLGRTIWASKGGVKIVKLFGCNESR